MPMRIEKETISQGFGIGVGMVQTLLGDIPIPFIGGSIPYPWNQMNTLGNFIGGGIAVGISQFNLFKNKDINTALKLYGMTAILGGVIIVVASHLTPLQPLALAAKTAPKEFYHSNGYLSLAPDGYYTSQYYPEFKRGSFWRRPQSRAQGWASDPTRNPMAARPTRVPITTIIA